MIYLDKDLVQTTEKEAVYTACQAEDLNVRECRDKNTVVENSKGTLYSYYCDEEEDKVLYFIPKAIKERL